MGSSVFLCNKARNQNLSLFKQPRTAYLNFDLIIVEVGLMQKVSKEKIYIYIFFIWIKCLLR